MRSNRVVRASDSLWLSRNCPGFDPSILRHSGFRRAADETVLKKVTKKIQKSPLKVGGNEKQWGSGRSQMLGNGLGPWRSRFIYNLNTQLLNKNHISFSALSSKMNK
jgi:hypothetical protein